MMRKKWGFCDVLCCDSLNVGSQCLAGLAAENTEVSLALWVLLAGVWKFCLAWTQHLGVVLETAPRLFPFIDGVTSMPLLSRVKCFNLKTCSKPINRMPKKHALSIAALRSPFVLIYTYT